MSLKLYIDYASQPSRAVLIFCLINKIPHEVVETKIFSGDQRKPEFVDKLNPAKKIPAIMDDEFALFESHSILRYLANTKNVPSHWYPTKDARKAAIIDRYLDWHHLNIRIGAGSLIFSTIVAPAVGLKRLPNVDEIKKTLAGSLKTIENVFLSDDKKFIGPNDEISIADLSCSCEILQLLILEYDFSTHPRLHKWLKGLLGIKEFLDGHENFFIQFGIDIKKFLQN